MTPDDIAMRRLMSQQISEHKFRCAKDLVDWIGAIQAQDHAMAKWEAAIMEKVE